MQADTTRGTHLLPHLLRHTNKKGTIKDIEMPRKYVIRIIVWICIAVLLAAVLLISVLFSPKGGKDAPDLDASKIDAVVFLFPDTDGQRRILRDKAEIERLVVQINATSGKQDLSTVSLGYDENRVELHEIAFYSGDYRYAVARYGYRTRDDVVYLAIGDDMDRTTDKNPENSQWYYHTFSYMDELYRLFELAEPWP